VWRKWPLGRYWRTGSLLDSDIKVVPARDATSVFGLMTDTTRTRPMLFEKHGRGVVVVVGLQEYMQLTGDSAVGFQQGQVPQSISPQAHHHRHWTQDSITVTATHFDDFEPILRKSGASAVRHPDTLLAKESPYEVFYIPFEHVNRRARLVIVGITPGMNQLEMAYAEAQRLLYLGMSHADILEAVKTLAAFGGEAMRPNLLRMLRHFNFAKMLEISDEADLWDGASALLHSTSVVPHAAFKNGKMFSGSFDEIIKVGALRERFEKDFVPTLSELADDALYVALGKTPYDALKHCVEMGVVRENQLLGALAHPSRSGGSQVAVYLGEKTLADLDPADPVRGRVEWLTAAYAGMRSAAAGRNGANPMPALPPLVVASKPVSPTPNANNPIGKTRKTVPVARKDSSTTTEIGLHYIVSRGKAAGTVLRPHEQDGHYIVSPTRFETDYQRIPLSEPIEPYIKQGLSLRMSAPGVAPSLISPGSILGRDKSAV
jgi:hypothetical protein